MVVTNDASKPDCFGEMEICPLKGKCDYAIECQEQTIAEWKKLMDGVCLG